MRGIMNALDLNNSQVEIILWSMGDLAQPEMTEELFELNSVVCIV